MPPAFLPAVGRLAEVDADEELVPPREAPGDRPAVRRAVAFDALLARAAPADFFARDFPPADRPAMEFFEADFFAGDRPPDDFPRADLLPDVFLPEDLPREAVPPLRILPRNEPLD